MEDHDSSKGCNSRHLRRSGRVIEPLARLIACAAALCGTAAGATDYVWSSGALSTSGVPTTLEAMDTLSIGAGGLKSVDVGFLTSGWVSWADDVRVTSNSRIVNFREWTSTNDAQIYGDGTFENLRVFRKSGGSGLTLLSTTGLYNSGSFIADSGTLAINSPGAYFNSGTRFEGAGRIQIVNNARFKELESQNLQFVNGTFTGESAWLFGQAEFLGGSFAGTWSIRASASLLVRSGTAKAMNGTMEVEGTLRFEDALNLGGQVSVLNGGVIDLPNDLGVAGSGRLDNDMGELRKSGGAGSSVISVPYHGLGGVNTQSGILRFTGGADLRSYNWFTGAGQTQIASVARVSNHLYSDNLVVVAGGKLDGQFSAEMNGTVGWTGGSVSGRWEIAPGSRLRATAGSRKTLDAWTFVAGTMELQDSVVLSSTAAFVWNRGTLVLTGDAGLSFGGSGTPTESLANEGLLRKDGGGTSAINDIAVRNSGTIEVRSGTLLFNGISQSFESGTQFNGSGTSQLIRSASFSGNYAANGRLLLSAGSFQGGSTAVTAHGLTDWSGGTLTGRWSLAGDALWRVLPGSSKTLDGRLDNAGHLVLADWMLMTPSGWLDNSGTLELMGGVGLQASFLSSNVINRGLIVKTGDGGDAFFSGVNLDNQSGGVVDVRAGRLVLTGFNTINRGTLKGMGGYRAPTLTNFGHLAPGTDVWPTAPLTLEGDLMQFGSLDIGLHGAHDFGSLWVSGSTLLSGGTLALNCVADCDLAAGTELVVLHSQGGLYGSFDQLVTSGFAIGTFEFSVTAHDVVVRVTQHAAAVVPEPPVWLLGLAGGALLAVRHRRVGPGSPRPQAAAG